MIGLEGVSKRFGEVEALSPLDLEVRTGEWLGLFGHNGSGKTTLIRLLLGLARPDTGQILLNGERPDREAWLRFRAKLGFMPERITFYEHLSGEATLRYFASLRGIEADRVMPMLELVGVAAAATRKVGTYSKGMRQRLNLAQALIGEPELLVLDEPIEGLDPSGVREVFEMLRSERNRTVVLSSHRISEVASQVDRVMVLSGGKVEALGRIDELRRNAHRPSMIHVFPVEPVDPALASAMNGLGDHVVTKRTTGWVVEVPQSEKVAFLLSLQAHRGAIQHLHVEEPRMEEVYLDRD